MEVKTKKRVALLKRAKEGPWTSTTVELVEECVTGVDSETQMSQPKQASPGRTIRLVKADERPAAPKTFADLSKAPPSRQKSTVSLGYY